MIKTMVKPQASTFRSLGLGKSSRSSRRIGEFSRSTKPASRPRFASYHFLALSRKATLTITVSTLVNGLVSSVMEDSMSFG